MQNAEASADVDASANALPAVASPAIPSSGICNIGT